MGREQRVGEVFVALADTLVDDYDVLDFLQFLVEQAVDLLDVDAAGVLLSEGQGRLSLAAASRESTRLLELFQIQQREGPCQDAYRTGEQVIEGSMQEATERWPTFASRALATGIQAAYGFPMRLRGQSVGALNLFREAPGKFDHEDVALAQALADSATIGILHQRVIMDERLRADQLQHALDSRVLIEQAKGVLATQEDVDMDEAFERLRRHARHHGESLRVVAKFVIGHRRLPD